jgi:hypothetical protein
MNNQAVVISAATREGRGGAVLDKKAVEAIIPGAFLFAFLPPAIAALWPADPPPPAVTAHSAIRTFLATAAANELAKILSPLNAEPETSIHIG